MNYDQLIERLLELKETGKNINKHEVAFVTKGDKYIPIESIKIFAEPDSHDSYIRLES